MHIAPFLSPMIIGQPAAISIFLANKQLYAIVLMRLRRVRIK